MANIFIKMDLKFELKDSKIKSLKENYKSDVNYNLCISARSTANNDISLAFEVGNDHSEGGDLTHELKGSKLVISCHGIFKINVKESYVKDVLDNKALWLFDSFGSYGQGLTMLEVKDGINKEEYEYRRRGETEIGIRYPLNINTHKTKSKV